MDIRAENHGRPHRRMCFPAALVMGRNLLTPGHLPAPGKKRKSKRWWQRKQPNNERKERGPRILLTGVGPWRANENELRLFASERKHTANPQPKKNECQNTKAESMISKQKISGVAGPMGRPHPSGVQLEGPRHRRDTRSSPSREPPPRKQNKKDNPLRNSCPEG